MIEIDSDNDVKFINDKNHSKACLSVKSDDSIVDNSDLTENSNDVISGSNKDSDTKKEKKTKIKKHQNVMSSKPSCSSSPQSSDIENTTITDSEKLKEDKPNSVIEAINVNKNKLRTERKENVKDLKSKVISEDPLQLDVIDAKNNITSVVNKKCKAFENVIDVDKIKYRKRREKLGIEPGDGSEDIMPLLEETENGDQAVSTIELESTAIIKICDVDKIISKKEKKALLEDGKIVHGREDFTTLGWDAKPEETENTDQAFSKIGQVYQQTDVAIKHSLPYWLSNPTHVSVDLQEAETPISELSYLDDNSKNNLKNAGIYFLFPVQLAVIPWLMQSKKQSLMVRPSDICVSTPTGSGKTLAFVLPIVQSLQDRVVCSIRALVVLPVSELAFQVFKVFQTFVTGTDLKVALLTGKKSFIAEQTALVKSSSHSSQSLVDIVVTTPGRVYDHIHKTNGFCLKRLKYLVIDEADRMMEEIHQGWLKQVEEAVFRDCLFPNCVCSSYKRTFYEPTSASNFGFTSQPLQKLLYSATLTHDPEQLHTLSLYKPKLFSASSATSAQEHKGICAIPFGLDMLQVICKKDVKPMVVCFLIKRHNFKKVLCFTESVERAHRLHLVLEEMGFLRIREISSFNTTVQRKIVLEQFSSGKVDVLVCSDLVARGMDIDDVDCVISYEVPMFVKTYIHRIGRSARAGKTGSAITLLSEAEVPHFRKLLNLAGIKLPEKVYVNSEDLKPFVDSYQKALAEADAKIK